MQEEKWKIVKWIISNADPSEHTVFLGGFKDQSLSEFSKFFYKGQFYAIYWDNTKQCFTVGKGPIGALRLDEAIGLMDWRYRNDGTPGGHWRFSISTLEQFRKWIHGQDMDKRVVKEYKLEFNIYA